MKYVLLIFFLSACSNKYQKGFNVNVVVTLDNGVSVSPSSEICDVQTEVGKIFLIFCHKATSVHFTRLDDVLGLDDNLLHATANYDRIYIEVNDITGPLDPTIGAGSFRVIGSFDSEVFRLN